jgi:hypothetical protein
MKMDLQKLVTKTGVVNNRIITAVKSLNLPNGEYAVFGSAILEVLGLRLSGDIDLIVTKRLYDQLASGSDWLRIRYDNGDEGLKYQGGADFEVFFECRWIPDFDRESILRLISRAVSLDGVSFVSLEDTLKWKSALARDKDRADVKLIEDFQASKIFKQNWQKRP